MVRATGHRGHPQRHDLPTEFHKSLQIVSKVIRMETDRLTERQRQIYEPQLL
jgi:hypothetical protein